MIRRCEGAAELERHIERVRDFSRRAESHYLLTKEFLKLSRAALNECRRQFERSEFQAGRRQVKRVVRPLVESVPTAPEG